MTLSKPLVSLGYRTDLIFPAFDGEILERDGYIVVRTPSNPTFWWGNYLIFRERPREGDVDDWRNAFRREIGGTPEVRHQAFGWDVPEEDPGDCAPFLAVGFRRTCCRVLTSARPRSPENSAPEVAVRALATDADWSAALDLQVLCREPDFQEAPFRTFRERSMTRYRAMAAAGLGHWFGAFVGDQLVADCGVFHDRRVGRYQSVETHPEYRRRGIASRLVAAAGQATIARFGLDTLVIVADDDSSACRIYQSAGFEPTQMQWGLEWRETEHAPEG